MNKIIATNRKARFNYHILDTYEAGIELKGNEVKSLREGKVSINEAFATVKNGEIFVHNMHIAPYEFANRFAADPKRKRKLLLHKGEIIRIAKRVSEKGLTLIPLKVYFKNNRVKVELGICKGKKLYDKREDIAKRDMEREMRRRGRMVSTGI